MALSTKRSGMVRLVQDDNDDVEAEDDVGAAAVESCSPPPAKIVSPSFTATRR